MKMKKIISFFASVAMLSTMIVAPQTVEATENPVAWDGTVATGYAAGDGTATNPYEISTAAELAYFAKSVNEAADADKTATTKVSTVSSKARTRYNVFSDKYYELTADINLGDREWTPIGNAVNMFNGHFNGNGHSVSDIKITTLQERIGFFGATGSNVDIDNLGLENIDFQISNSATISITLDDSTKTTIRCFGVGGLAGSITGGTFDSCYVKNAVVKNKQTGITEKGAGAMFGNAYATGSGSATVNNCYVLNVDVKGTWDGAFMGSPWADMNSVLINGSTNYYGDLMTVTLNNCYAGGEITVSGGLKDGFVRNKKNKAVANNCYTTAEFTPDTTTNEGMSVVATTSSKAKIAAEITSYANTDFAKDNSKTPINEGFPVLSYEVDWIDFWDGETIATGYAKGKGTSAEPYEISTAAELAYFAKSVNEETVDKTEAEIKDSYGRARYNVYTDKYFKLTKNIDLRNYEWTPIGNATQHFNGHFDGNGYVISNIKITTLQERIGFFGATGSNVDIDKVGLDGVDIQYHNASSIPIKKGDGTDATARCYGSGAIVGTFAGGTFDDCYVKNAVVKNTNTGASENATGGMFGIGTATEHYWSSAANPQVPSTMSINNCYVYNVELSASVSSTIGGFIGNEYYQNASGVSAYDDKFGSFTITNCYVGGNIVLGTSAREDSFGCTTLSGNAESGFRKSLVPVNSYTDGTLCARNETNKYDSMLSESSKKTDIILNLIRTENSHFAADNATEPINGGYPVLLMEKTWATPTDVLNGLTYASFLGDQASNHVTENLTLPSTFRYSEIDVPLVWTSADDTVISISGNTATIHEAFEDKTVTLTVMDGMYATTKDFEVTVPGALTRALVAGLNSQAQNQITQNITIPTSVVFNETTYPVSWITSNKAILSVQGVVGSVIYDSPVVLTAYANGTTYSYNFVVRKSAAAGTTAKSDNFESYAVGTDITKQTDKGWSNPTSSSGVDFTVEEDPTNSGNKVLKVSRYVLLKNGSYVNVDTGETGLDPAADEAASFKLDENINSGKIQVSARLMFTSDGASGDSQIAGLLFDGLAKSGFANDNMILFRRKNASNSWFASNDTQYFNMAGKYLSYKWYDISVIIDLDKNTYTVTAGCDGKTSVHNGVLKDTVTNKDISAINIFSIRTNDYVAEGRSEWYIDDFAVKEITLSDAEITAYDMGNISMPGMINSNFELDLNGDEGSNISWASDNANLTIAEGVAIPVFTETEQTVKLTATVSYGTSQISKDYIVTLPAKHRYSIIAPEISSGDVTNTVLTNNGKITAANIMLNGVEESNDTLYAVLYDSNDRFVSQTNVVIKNATLNSATRVEFTTPLQLPSDVSGYKLKLFVWSMPTVRPLAEEYTSDVPNTQLWILGDSTVCHYYDYEYPMQGWGEYIDLHLNDRVTKFNKAHGGYKAVNYTGTQNAFSGDALSSFIDDVKAGDYVMIGLGINDRALGMATFEKELDNIIGQFETKGATVIIVTPIACAYDSGGTFYRSFWNESGTESTNFLINYADENGLVCLDLNKAMYDKFVEEFGPTPITGTKLQELREKYFMCNISTDRFNEYPTSFTGNDTTHLNEYGAKWTAELVAELLANSGSKLGQYVK